MTGCTQGPHGGIAQASVTLRRWFRHPSSPLAHPYLQGLRWLVGLLDHGLNGILADDMVSNECPNGGNLSLSFMACHVFFIPSPFQPMWFPSAP